MEICPANLQIQKAEISEPGEIILASLLISNPINPTNRIIFPLPEGTKFTCCPFNWQFSDQWEDVDEAVLLSALWNTRPAALRQVTEREADESLLTKWWQLTFLCVLLTLCRGVFLRS